MFGPRSPMSQVRKNRPPIPWISGGSVRIGVDLGRIALDVTSNVVFKWPTGASGVNFSFVDAPDATGRDE